MDPSWDIVYPKKGYHFPDSSDKFAVISILRETQLILMILLVIDPTSHIPEKILLKYSMILSFCCHYILPLLQPEPLDLGPVDCRSFLCRCAQIRSALSGPSAG